MMNLSAYADLARVPASESLRVANLLDLQVSAGFSEVDLARLVVHGLPIRSGKALKGLLRTLLNAQIDVVPEATLRRAAKARKTLSREHSESIYQIGRVIDAVSTVYRGDQQRIAAFLGRPHPLLDGETPLDMARSSSAGADAVLNLLHRAEAGVAV